MYVPGSDELFSHGALSVIMESVRESVVKEVERAPEDHVLQADEDAWVAALVERRALKPPLLGAPTMDEPEEVQVDVRWEQQSRLILDPTQPFHIPGYRVVVHIPFTGDGALFRFHPSQHSISPPSAEIGNQELLHTITYPHDRPMSIKAQAEMLIEKIEGDLRWVRSDSERFNSQALELTARTAIQNRRARIERHKAHIAATGLPIRASDDDRTYIADAIVRRPAPVLAASPDSTPIPLEPALASDVFEHILGVIRSVSLDMERSPGTYSSMKEEDLRQVQLSALNSHYRGQATAEAFNVNGKTDILVRYENQNIFIAECKFWSGAKSFTDTIDQLFRYTAWRDTKLALIVFVHEKDLTSILEKGRDALREHPQFVESEDAASETELRAKMSWPGDERRFSDLNVFFVHIPT